MQRLESFTLKCQCLRVRFQIQEAEVLSARNRVLGKTFLTNKGAITCMGRKSEKEVVKLTAEELNKEIRIEKYVPNPQKTLH